MVKKRQPGLQHRMKPKPIVEDDHQHGSKLINKVAIVTGGDSGIGHAVALLFAKEGADIVIAYLNEHQDAKNVKQQIESLGRECLLIAGDLAKEAHCRKIVKRTLSKFGRIDILVNNAAEQHPQEDFSKVTYKQMVKTFETNIFSYFNLTRAALPHLKRGSSIINTSSVTCYRGSSHLIDYSATKGAVVGFTRSLSEALVEKGIRVNGVAPGPIWTPLIVATFRPKDIKDFGKKTPMKRAGEPVEVAYCYLFLAADDSSYMTGQFLHPNGGEIING